LDATGTYLGGGNGPTLGPFREGDAVSIVTKVDDCEVREATHEEGRRLFDERARELLGISGEEFLRRWDAGEYTDAVDPAVNAVALLIPFGR
jgi:hypothetical protein